jgi:hypothetical protein
MPWVTSSFSDGGANCVTVNLGVPGVVGLADSKFPNLPAILVSHEAWNHFTDFLTAYPVDENPLATIPQSKIELYELDLAKANWVSTSRTPVSGQVQLASLPKGAVALRLADSEATLRYTHTEWIAFLRGLDAGEFTLQAAA